MAGDQMGHHIDLYQPSVGRIFHLGRLLSVLINHLRKPGFLSTQLDRGQHHLLAAPGLGAQGSSSQQHELHPFDQHGIKVLSRTSQCRQLSQFGDFPRNPSLLCLHFRFRRVPIVAARRFGGKIKAVTKLH